MTAQARLLLSALLLCCIATAGEPVAPPVTAAPAAAVKAEPGDLFRPLRNRRYWLSPDGRYLIEAVPVETGTATLPEGVSFGSSPWYSDFAVLGEDVFVTDLSTKKFQKIRSGRGDSTVGSLIWLDSRRLVWSIRWSDNSVIERVQIVDLPADATEGDFVTSTVIGKDIGVIAIQPGDPVRILVMSGDIDGTSAYRVDPLAPLAPQLTDANLVLGPFMGLDDLVVDDAGAIRSVILRRRIGERRVMWRERSDAPWRAIYTLPSDPYLGIELAGVTAEGRLLLITNHGTSRSVLRELDPRTGALGRIVAEHPRNDVRAPYLSSNTTRLLGVWYGDSQLQVEFLDEGLKRLQAEVAAKIAGSVARIVSVSDDLSRAVVLTASSDNPGRYSLYDAKEKKLQLVEVAAPWLKGKRLSRAREVAFKARDGLELHGQFTPPLDPGVGTKPPLILMPHGGPLGVRDYDLYDADVQLLASRGYAVLQVDFRGSGGYGRDFLTAGYRQWGLKMQDDLVDAMRWINDQGSIDPARVCIYGASYGGYAAVMGLIKTPELFRCGVTLSGVSDLSLFFESDDFENDPTVIEVLKNVLGDPEKERDALRQVSPAFLAKGITRPLFIAHGERDTRVDPEHAWRLRATIEAGGGKVEFLVLEGEGHGIRRGANKARFQAKLVEFLDRNLGMPAASTAVTSPAPH